MDTAFSKFIRQRDGKCVQCGTDKNLTCGHLFSRVAHSTRWDEGNCFGQCAGHNLSHEYNPHAFINWYIEKHGLQAYRELYHRNQKTHKFTISELEQMLNKYEAALSKPPESSPPTTTKSRPRRSMSLST